MSFYLWPRFKVCILKQNMRLFRSFMSEAERHESHVFAKWLLDVGDGRLGTPTDDGDEDARWIDISHQYCIQPSEHALSDLIHFLYDHDTLITPTTASLQEKAIVCPTNDIADAVNADILATIPGFQKTYLSNDQVIPMGKETSESELLYPMEYLNTLSFPGFPPHELHSKIGTPIVLLRNINLASGLCIGTRMIVTCLWSKPIEAQVITGTRVGEKVYIHRIPITQKDPNLSFVFKRTQFLVKVCYAMTINKSQWQSLSKIGVYLPKPVFSHGQLYVALSRATSPNGLKALMNQQNKQPANTTKNITYKTFLHTIHQNRSNLSGTPPEDVLEQLAKTAEEKTLHPTAKRSLAKDEPTTTKKKRED